MLTHPNALEQILSVVDPAFVSCVGDHHVVSKSTKNIRTYGNRLHDYHMVNSNRHDERSYFKLVNQIETEIYWSTAGTFNSIANHIRKTLLQNHKSCLYRAKRGDMKCRYADAYIHWCKFIHNFKNCWQVDNGDRPKRPIKDDIRYVSMQDDLELYWLVSSWNDGKRNRKYESVTATKWVVSKFLSLILLNHFYNWVRVVSQRKSTEEIMYLPFQYQNLPLSVLKVPTDKREELEFHVWYEPNQILKVRNLVLQCPYNNVKKRRNYYMDENEIRIAKLIERF